MVIIIYNYIKNFIKIIQEIQAERNKMINFIIFKLLAMKDK